MDKPDLIPITLITGFLGSGKTTLVNRLLEQSNEKIAVIVNEFGDVGIDDRLILRSDEEIMELTTGSICCVAKNDTIKVLETLLDRRNEGFSRVIIETTGLANPAPLLRAFQVKPLLNEVFKLESVVAVVDTSHALEQFSDRPEMARQIALADIILINKTDLTDGGIVFLVEQKLRQINPLARQFRTQNSNLDATFLLQPSLFEEERPLIQVDLDDSEHHSHDEEISSFVLHEEKPLDLTKVGRWIGEHILLSGEDLLRYKGILSIAGMEERFIFQGVHHQFTNQKDRLWKNNEKRTSEVVVIGKNINHQDLEQSFKACIAV